MGGRPPLLLLLHGFGANEDDLFSLAPYLDERFLVISARAPVTLGPMSYGWFNLGFTPEGVVVDRKEVEEARRTVRAFIGEVVTHYQVDRDRVFLMGFSQGAMISLGVALTVPGIAAGVVVMSGRLMSQTVEQIPDRDALLNLPIFLAHGTRDMVLPIGHGRDARTRLAALPVDLTYHEYDMAHEVTADELQDITAWLTVQLDRTASTQFIN
ncbi:MAG: alpha/beta hydrolase [Blastocatellia bacterium]